jgi:hypothetical protein
MLLTYVTAPACLRTDVQRVFALGASDCSPQEEHFDLIHIPSTVARELHAPGFRPAVEEIRARCIEFVRSEVLEHQAAVFNPYFEVEVFIHVEQTLILEQCCIIDRDFKRALELLIRRHQPLGVALIWVGTRI